MAGIPGIDIAQSAIGIGEAVSGLINEGKAKEEARRLASTRPQYEVDPQVGQDLNLAESELGSNVSAGERAYATLNNGQYSSAIGSTLKAGGNPNNIGEIYGNNVDGRLKLAMMRDNLRLNQIQNYVRASQRQEDANTTKWQVNKFAPWADAAQANAAAKSGAQKQVTEGLSTFGASVGNADQSLTEQNQFKIPKYATGVPSTSYSNNSPTDFNPMYTNANVLTNRTEPFPTFNN